ncbi:MAG: response regulator [Sandaracinaceae bacterium]|nr:response regulator [Sandaracinaceae bacterium]
MPQRPHDTALGLARQRFVDSLPQKAGELRGALALLVGSPESPRPRDELRARLQALYASAQVFRMNVLAAALQEGATTLELARSEAREVSQAELDELTNLVATLPSLVDGGAPNVRPSMVPAPSTPPSQPPPAASIAPLVNVGSTPPPALDAAPVSSPERPSARPVARAHKPTMMGFQPPTAPPPPPSLSPAPLGRPSQPAPAPIAPLPPPPAVSAPARVAPHAAAPAPVRAPAPAAAPAPTRASQPAPRPVAPSTRPASTVAVSTPIARVKVATVASREAEVIQVKPPAPFTTSSAAVVGAARGQAEDPGAQSTSAGGYAAPAQSIVSALLCTDTASETLIRAALPPERFEILVASNTEEATQLAWNSAPDLILADATVCLGPNGLLARLRRDALTDFVPVVVLFQPGVPVDPIALREAGAVDSLRKPLLIKTILQTVHRVADLGEAATWAPLGDLTVNDVADRIAAEIRRGLVLSTDRGPDVAVPLGDGSEVLAAAWAAIARVRAHLSERSAGRVHFRDPAGRRGPALVSLHDLEPTAEEEARDSASEAEVSLRGRRVIVADDDPAVRWFFAQLLEDEGASVVQAEDGAVALAAARAEPPDVIVSDILMPNMDGLALCRALSRDPSVSETPVILLSWREDFLSRMRELRAGARGYLRKEAESTQILAKVRDVLRGRSQFEARLRAGGAVRGRVEGLGIPCLLSTLLRERENALLTVRDAFNLFEVEVQQRAIVSVSSTATDGGFARGDRALRMLVGVSTGRFAVEEVDPAVRHSMAGGAPQLGVAEACARLGALIDSVSGEALARVESLGLDEDALGSFEASAPGEVGAVAAALSAGQTPRQLLVGSIHAPQAVEAALIELARRGVILGVHGDAGEDLVATNLRARREARTHSQPGEAPASFQTAPAPRVQPTIREESADADTAEPLLLSTARAPQALPPAPEPLLLIPAAVVPALRAPQPAAPRDVDADTDTDSQPGEAEDDDDLPERDGFGPLMWFAVLFVLAAIGYVGYTMMLDSQRRAADPSSSNDAPETAPAEATAADDAPAAADPSEAAPDPSAQVPDGTPREDGLSFGTQQPGVRLEGATVPAGHGVLHVLETSRPDVLVSVGDQDLGTPPQQIALPEGRHAVRYRMGSQVIDRYYFVRSAHTRVVPVPES